MQTRHFEIEHTRTADETRTVPVTISSTYPVDRGGFKEVLLHGKDNIDLSRSPLSVIESHNTGVVNIGLIEGLKTDGTRLRGTLRLGASARADELWTDIKLGVVRNLSVGYSVDATRDQGDTVFVTRWTPYETSIVAVGADPQAGINRSQTFNSEHQNMTIQNQDPAQAGRQRAADLAAREAEFVRRDELEGFAQSFAEFGGREIADKARSTGASLDWCRGVVAGKMQNKPLSLGGGFGGPFEQRAFEQSEARIETPRARTHYDSDKPFGGQEGEKRSHRFGMWVKGSVLGDKRAQDWCRSNGVRAMGEDTLTGGGATVPQEFASEFIFLAEQYGVARKSMRRWIMGTDQLMIPRRDGGPTAYFVGENTEVTASDQSWGQIALHAKTLATLIRVGNNLLEDNVVNLGSVLAQDVALAFATTEDNCAFSGDGTGTYGGITGIKTKLDAATTFKSYVTATSTHNLMGEIDAADLSKLMGRLPAYARPNAKFYCSQAAVSEIFERIMATSGGNTILSMSDKPVLRYMGHEIVVTQAMPNDGTADLTAKTIVLFGDMTLAAAFGDRRNIELRQDPSRYLEFLQTAIVASERFDVVVHDIGSASVAGPIVGLVGN